MMNDATQEVVRKFKDTEGNYIWRPGLAEGQPPLLLGKPVATDDNFPDVGANAFPIAFGDYKRGYLIVDRFGIRVLRDPYTKKPYTLFYTTKRVGGGVQNYEAIKLLKVAA
jgi:HK97 family phage major capsid protein